MDFITPFEFPLMKWLAASARRITAIAWVSIVVGLCALGWTWHQQQTGVAVTWFRHMQEPVTRGEQPELFAGIIRYDFFMSLGLIVCGILMRGAVAAVSHYDIFAPGQNVKGIDDK